MVLDLKKIHLKSSIEDDALWIVEQIPRSVHVLHIRDGLHKKIHIYGTFFQVKNSYCVHV